MAEKISRRGRPPKNIAHVARVPMCVTVSAEIRRKLEIAAHASGRSLSSEIEAALERLLIIDSVLAAHRAGVRLNRIGGSSAPRK